MSAVTKAAVKERPIIFGAESVRAIIDGHKTQTRRVVKFPHEVPAHYLGMNGADDHVFAPAHNSRWGGQLRCPYGDPGDRLWAREKWRVSSRHGNQFLEYADGLCKEFPLGTRRQDERPGFRSPLFMPRWASRITLEITAVRVERLQDITEADAIGEGVKEFAYTYAETSPYCPWASTDVCARAFGEEKLALGVMEQTAVGAYRRAWDRLNLQRSFGWDSNPWVWVVEFKRLPG